MEKIYFPDKTLAKMRVRGITESEINDVFRRGSHGKTHDGARLAVKKYSGYEIGIFYDRSYKVGCDYVVTAVWKRRRN